MLPAVGLGTLHSPNFFLASGTWKVVRGRILAKGWRRGWKWGVGGKRVWWWRNPSIRCSYNLLLNSHTAPFIPCTAGSQMCLTAVCSPWTLPQACTSTWLSVPRCHRKQVKCIQHGREASHGFPVITFVKVAPWRRQAWRARSYERDSSWALILHAGRAGPAGAAAGRIASLSCAAQPGSDFLWRWLNLLI